MERSRHCARPGCGASAAAALSYDYGSRTVWLDCLDDEPDPVANDMCATHAATLTVPLGWALEDNRTPIVQLRPPLAV
ncbi:MAG: DUF3499 family protein [Acidimicrobiales bacterium]